MKLTPYSPNDSRCIAPEVGEVFSEAVDTMILNGVNCPELARRAGINVSNIYAYRRGHQTPADETMPALRRAFRPLVLDL